MTEKVLNLDDRLGRSLGRTGRVNGLSVKVTENERDELGAVAKQESQALGEWAREVLLREARRTQSDALFTEIVATRMLLNYVLQPLACGQVMTPEGFASVALHIRAEKHKQAEELMRQYTAERVKE